MEHRQSQSHSEQSVGVYSSSSIVDGGGQSASTFGYAASAQRQQSGYKMSQIVESMKPLIQGMLGKAAQVGSQIVGAVWDDFEKMPMWQKILVAVAVAVAVAALGYCSWKIVAGNWDAIKAGVAKGGEYLASKAQQMVDNFDTNLAIQDVMDLFKEKASQLSVVPQDAQSILQQFIGCGYGPVLPLIVGTLAGSLGIALSEDLSD